MLIDRTEIVIEAGKGGAGMVSFGKMAHSGPDGGDGGKGGDIYFSAKSDLTLLNQFTMKKLFYAMDGLPGGRNKKSGKDGTDLTINLPIGTEVIQKDTGELLFDLTNIDQTEKICIGGKGGRGNYRFRSSRNTTPKYAQPGLPGEKKELILNLKLIAEYGLIGLPNAGKSSLLNELTRSNAKIADYPFTTLSPNLGVIGTKVIADIPGLIEGASKGKGLGVSFLKHIEKVKTILHCISVDSADPLKDYQTIINEINAYNENILKKNEIILLTKSDLLDKKEINKIKKILGNKSKKILSVSIYDPDSITQLKKIIS